VFAAQRPRANTVTARSVLQLAKKDLIRQLMHDCTVDRYTAHQILRKVAERVRRARLYQRGSRRETLRNLRWMLASLTQNYFLTQSPILDL
jgi:hypothetical protein